MVENGGVSECEFQSFEGRLTSFRPIPFNGGVRESGERDGNVRIIPYKPSVEIAETKEGLNVFDLPGYRPFCDGGNLFR
jgi:hypothetical protein